MFIIPPRIIEHEIKLPHRPPVAAVENCGEIPKNFPKEYKGTPPTPPTQNPTQNTSNPTIAYRNIDPNKGNIVDFSA